MGRLTSGLGSAASQSGVTAAALQSGCAAGPIGGAGGQSLGFKAAVLLFGLALVVLLPGIQVSLFDRDEGWYAEVCREMLASGNWLVPRLEGQDWLAKPPLTYWLVTASFRLLGVGEWQARLVPVLLMACNVVLVAGLGARLYGRRIGVLAGVLFITAGLPALVGKMLLTDQAMLLSTLMAVHLHWRIAEGERGTEGRRDRGTEGWRDGATEGQREGGTEGPGDKETRGQGESASPQPGIHNPQSAIHLFAAGYWLAIGLGILAKGPATLVFAGAFGLALLTTPGRRGWIRDWRYWVWLPAALLVAAPWYLYIARSAGGTLVSQFLGYEIASRIAGTPHGHGGPPGYYVLLSLAGLLPWTAFVPGVLVIAFRRRREEPDLRLLLVWLALPWVVLELIHSKLPHYILPCYVPLMILLARMLDEGLRTDRSRSAYPRGEQRVLGLWPAVMIGMGAAAIVGAVIWWGSRWGWAAIATGAVLIVGFILVERMLRRSFGRAFVAAIGATVAFHLVFGLVFLPSLDPLRLSRNLGQVVNSMNTGGWPVYLCGYEEPSTFFYLKAGGRTVRRYEAAQLYAHPEARWMLLITERELSGLPEPTARRLKSYGFPVSGFNYVKMSRETVWVTTPRLRSGL